MPAGVSTLYGPLRRETEHPLQPDDSYFLIRLHDVQAFFSAGPMDLNLARLQTGYYAVIGSLTDETWPRMLELDAHGRLTDYSGHELTRLSYAVIQVQVIKRREQEALRKTTWGELLEIARDAMLTRNFQSDDERRKAWQEWLMSLKQVRFLALKDQSTLLREINDDYCLVVEDSAKNWYEHDPYVRVSMRIHHIDH